MFAFVRGWKTVDFAITVCTDELGPVIPRAFDPAPGWSATGHRIKAPLDYERGPEKTWVYGALRVRDGKVLTRCAASRNSKGYIASLTDIEADNPTGACWLNLQEGWWRLFRRDALAGQSEASPKEIEQATRVATAQLNLRAKPWVWGRPAKTPRHRRRLFLLWRSFAL
jgi:hypothetical protein